MVYSLLRCRGYLIIFICIQYVTFRVTELDAAAVLEVYLKAILWNSLHSIPKYRMNFMVMTELSATPLKTWAFPAHGSHVRNRTLVVFGDFLSESVRNPIFVITNYSKNLTYSIRAEVTGETDESWHFNALLPSLSRLALWKETSRWAYKLTKFGHGSFHLFFRWYCDRQSCGQQCHQSCTHWSRNSKPCLILNVPHRSMINQSLLEFGMRLYLRARINFPLDLEREPRQNNDNDTWTTPYSPLYVFLSVNEVDLPDGETATVVSVKASIQNTPMEQDVLRYSLDDLVRSDWIRRCTIRKEAFMEGSSAKISIRQTSPRASFNDVVKSKPKTHNLLAVGFWILLTMLFILSCLIVQLLRRRMETQKGDNYVSGHLYPRPQSTEETVAV